ncbi:MAG: LemA family protein [Bacteroidales bacterium]|nr:LemA family protein [Bacteroidales bacterium]
MKKSIIVLIVLGIIVIAAFMQGKNVYNKLIVMDESVQSAWSQVENQYQRRMDLIPNLVNTVKGYADFEQETLTGVIEARAKATQTQINAGEMNAESLQKFQESQAELGSALQRLMVVVERYPDLKANQNFLELQAQLEGTENRISVERGRFNETAQGYNTYARSFPTNLFVGIFGLDKTKAYFSNDPGAEKAPVVQF